MSVAVKPAEEQVSGLPPHHTLGQREFLTTYGKPLAEMMSALMQPIYTGPQDASCALASQVTLKRKPLGAQGFAVEALATGRNGRKPQEGRGSLRPMRGGFLVGEMASGKTFMSLLYLQLADQLANGIQSTPWQPYRQEAYPAVVILPVTLLEKFAREAVETIPGIKPVIVLPIRKGKQSQEQALVGQEDGEASEEREAEASIDSEASLRAFDPTYKGGNLSAVGVMNRVARRIRFDLHTWEEECQWLMTAWQQKHQEQLFAWRTERARILSLWKEACAQAERDGQGLPDRPTIPARPAALPRPVLPPKPKHLVILSQSVAKLGSAWKPSYILRPLTMRVNGKTRLVHDEEGSPQFVPCCPRCMQPLVLGQKKASGGDAQVIYLTEQDLLGKEPGERKKRWCSNLVRRWNPETQKYRQVRCGEPLWQSIPALIPPKLQPLSQRSAEERRAALPLPGEGRSFQRIIPAPALDAWQASANNAEARARLLRAYQADAWQWRPTTHNPHPPCVLEAPERRYPLAEYILEHLPHLFRTALVDEVHQYSGSGTAQGYAAQALVDASENALGMTGTLFGGFARSLFHLLRRMVPEFRREYGPRDLLRFIRLFGVQQRTYKERFDAEGHAVGAVSKRRQEPEPKDLPGISPMVLKYLLPIMVTVELKDVWLNPTPYTEKVVMVDMGPVIGPAYEQLQRTSTQALRQLLSRGDRRAVSAWFHGLLRYPNMPWQGMEIVHPSKKLVLGTAPKTSEDYITPKERAMLRDVRKERAEGRRVLLYAQSTNKHDIQPRLLRLLEADDKRWRQGLPILGSDGDPTDSQFPPRPAHLPPVRIKILRSGSPPARKREAWLRQAIKEGVDVLICHSKLVEVGLDLIGFPTIMAYEIIFSTTSMRQAFRRSWRPGQTKEVRVYIYCYEYPRLGAGTMETRGLELIARKAAVSMMLEGKLPPAESMARQVMAKGGASDPMMELALAMVEVNGQEQLTVKGSIEEAFRQMNEAAQVEAHIDRPVLIAPEAASDLAGAAGAEVVSVEIERTGGVSAPRAPRQADGFSRELLPPVPTVVGARAVPLFEQPETEAAFVPGRAQQPGGSPGENVARKRHKRHHKKQRGKIAPASGQSGARANASAPPGLHQPAPAAAPQQRVRFGQPPQRQRDRKPDTPSASPSLWGTMDTPPPMPNGLIPERSEGAYTPPGAPVVVASAVEQVPVAALVHEGEASATSFVGAASDEVCVDCGARVEWFSRGGRSLLRRLLASQEAWRSAGGVP